ncbi:MAG TPA: hypothetical protein PKO16_01895 [Bacteroidia bacterium]|nr:hypothetical protein [Bacteroidia bacterium]
MNTIVKRPVIITVANIIGIIWSLANFVFVFSPFIKKISNWAPAVYGLIVALQFISFIGTWHMKRWGVLMFITTVILKTAFSFLIDDISYVGVSLSVVFTILFLFFYTKMEEEL